MPVEPTRHAPERHRRAGFERLLRGQARQLLRQPVGAIPREGLGIADAAPGGNRDADFAAVGRKAQRHPFGLPQPPDHERQILPADPQGARLHHARRGGAAQPVDHPPTPAIPLPARYVLPAAPRAPR
jgi:hypothetical protein